VAAAHDSGPLTGIRSSPSGAYLLLLFKGAPAELWSTGALHPSDPRAAPDHGRQPAPDAGGASLGALPRPHRLRFIDLGFSAAEWVMPDDATDPWELREGPQHTFWSLHGGGDENKPPAVSTSTTKAPPDFGSLVSVGGSGPAATGGNSGLGTPKSSGFGTPKGGASPVLPLGFGARWRRSGPPAVAAESAARLVRDLSMIRERSTLDPQVRFGVGLRFRVGFGWRGYASTVLLTQHHTRHAPTPLQAVSAVSLAVMDPLAQQRERTEAGRAAEAFPEERLAFSLSK
jgi:hypothetical protein